MASTTYDQDRNSVVTSVNSANVNTNLVAARRGRCGVCITNASTQILYVKLGTTASSSDYTVALVAGAYYETPFGYTGRIDGIWAAANGSAKITEIF